MNATRILLAAAWCVWLMPAVVRAGDAGAAQAPAGFASGFELEPTAMPLERPAMTSALALRGPLAMGGAAFEARAKDAPNAAAASSRMATVLDARRASILLRSLTVPGWGQATLGRTTSARVFGLIEAGIWGTFAAFQVQDRLRTNSYERTARIGAGIDLDGRDEEFRRIVGSFLSSEEYNLYVVARDAANLHYNDPAAMSAYIDQHSLRGADAWAWPDVESLLRYRDQRKDAQRAQQRANTTLAVAIANRLVSALHAARVAHRPVPDKTSWHLDVAPGAEGDWTALQLGVRARF